MHFCNLISSSQKKKTWLGHHRGCRWHSMWYILQWWAIKLYCTVVV